MTLKANREVLNKRLEESTQEIVKEAKSKAILTAQRVEFLAYLQAKVAQKPEGFFADMLARLGRDTELTENMANAIRKCMSGDIEREANKNKPVDESKLPKLTMKMRKWWTEQNNLDSRVITGIVLVETAKAYKMKGTADMIEGTFCMRCDRELTEPASMVIGFGPICAGKLGIPYPTDILTAPKKVRQAYRNELLNKLHDQKFELWVPKSQIQEILKEERPSA